MIEQYPLYLNNNYNNYNYNNFFYNKKPYIAEIDYIEYLINNFHIFYHLVKFKNYEYIKNCKITNQIEVPYNIFKKYKYINDNLIIIIIYNCKDEEFSGFAKLEYALKEKEENDALRIKYGIRWLWENGINYSEVSHLVNKSDKNHFLCEGKNWCPIHPDLGNYMCRLMLKRLNQKEVIELLNKKQIFQEQLLFNLYKHKKFKKFEEENLDNDDEDNYDDYKSHNFKYKKEFHEDYIDYKKNYNFRRKRRRRKYLKY